MKNKLLIRLTKLLSFGLIFTLLSAAPAYASSEEYTAGSSIKESAESVEEDAERPAEDPYGIMTTDLLSGGWKQNNTGWWYEYSDGSYPASTWRQINKKWYWFNKSGYWVDNNTYEKGTIKGVDVSKWDETIDWKAVKNDGFQFAFIRVGHGDHVIDPYYKQNMTNANAAGILTGVYFYSTATSEEESRGDARFVIENLKGYAVTYPVVIDLEGRSIYKNLSKTQVAMIAKAFCDEIRAAGYTPMLYVDEDFYRNYIDVSLVGDVELWVARYNNIHADDIPRDVWQCTSTGRVAGIRKSTGNVDIDFAYTDYSKIISSAGTWEKNRTGYWYRYHAGGYPASKWEQINGKWYWFNKSGYMETGWVKTGGKWYYMNKSGAMTTGWQKVGGKWYYMNGNGAMQTGWEQVNGKWYYMNKSGVMLTGWQKVGGKWYYMNKSGAMLTGWQKISGKWYYLKDSGAMTTGWQLVDGKWYYMNKSGVMLTGWQKVKGKWYYMNKSGAMLTGWQKISKKWYYLKDSGAMATGWQLVDGKWYYMNKSGVMLTGKQKIGKKTYTFSSSGALR